MKTMMLAKLATWVCGVTLLSGCGSPPKPYVIRHGGYLAEKDYVGLQQATDKVKPFQFPKKWPAAAPVWSYHMETNLDFGQFPAIAVPTVKAWNSKAWKGELSVWTNRVGESVAKALTQKKLFQQVKRVDTEEPLALAGAVTFFHDGSATYGAVFGPASGAKNQNFLQAEFKVMAHGKQVGVIQAHGVQGQNWIALTAAASVEDQVGRAVAEAMKRIKEQKTTSEATQDAVMAGWFME